MDNQLSEMTRRFSNAFVPVMHIFHNIASEVSKTADLSLAQYRVIMLVYQSGPMSINALKNGLNTAQSSASEMVNRLVNSGFLQREKSPNDRRVTMFQLTDRARDLIQQRTRMMQDVFRDMLEHFSAEEQNQLVESFELILKLMVKVRNQKNI
jgi:DNA-binding MarR family transcriptional regulator